MRQSLPIWAAKGTCWTASYGPGSQHCQSGTPEFIGACVETLDTLGLSGRCLLRLDSGNDAAVNFDHFGKNFFIVKRNLRKECREQWLATARRVGTKCESRDGKNIYIGYVDHLRPGGDPSRACVPVVFEVIERLTDRDGNYLLVPEIEVNTYWTNLPCQAQEVIGLYHDHGTSEQFHSELKSDLDIERLPSGKTLRKQDHSSVWHARLQPPAGTRTGSDPPRRARPQKITVSRWRLKTVLQNIIYCAVRIVRHAGRIELHYGKRCPWFDIIADIARSRA